MHVTEVRPTAVITTAARSLSIPTMIQQGHGQFVVPRTVIKNENDLVFISVQG